ncbi:DUF3944 domain-containing protein [Klebsiella pneumoniae]|uniref:DUF3944 domain-containing protein n=1 Tax=Klebsiella TaxID=570 RepID=UPI0003BEECA6|nr:DUF3944 domain-containing protein [Klebsiella pneumoniae]HBR1781638.1 DUF3944 domain-containing protein [Klebsiella quasipneumoniae subsp. quasipneumoniae]HBY0605545.1 DUF3944 domain-containing protein [Klebsiella pneumoniae subsp. pneumoniae]ESL46802.1 hypothetical protein L461_03439 [Klebsiella pneumoniae BIDMC 25]MBA1490382.1 DUF3944 domain-containing protein [Klebsiella pneumoniae]MBD7727373.1 DUF3944 domain-containing protein [Klebsiella pneumoniae]
MAYRDDADLEFLSQCTDEDLNDLVQCLIYDKDGKTRWTEELSTSEAYKKYKPQHSKYWKEIAAEIQCFGGNTFATLARGGKGVLYKEVLCDVCDKLKVNYNKKSSVDVIESNLLMTIMTKALESMSQDEIKELGEGLGVKNVAGLTAKTLTAAFQAIFRAGGFKSYQLTAIIVNQVLKVLIGRGLSFAATGTLMRTLSILTGPVGWGITGIWTVVDIGSTAYRVTIPSVLQVAYLRSKIANGISDEITFD